MAKKKYWQSFGELNNTEANKNCRKMNSRKTCLLKLPRKGLSRSSRIAQGFLKYLGFSTAAAMAAASCETPVKKSDPLSKQTGTIYPGCRRLLCYYLCKWRRSDSIVAKVRDGRPIKIEGNTLSNYTKGGTSARVQASVLDLYDTARLRIPMANANADSYRRP